MVPANTKITGIDIRLMYSTEISATTTGTNMGVFEVRLTTIDALPFCQLLRYLSEYSRDKIANGVQNSAGLTKGRQ